MDNETKRWACKDLAEALEIFKARKEQGISVALDSLGEYAQNEQQAFENLSGYLNCILQISRQSADAAVAVKLSALGLSFSKVLAEDNLKRILTTAGEAGVTIEVDIEGTPSVAATIEIAEAVAKENPGLVLALQAYLDRCPEDIKTCLDSGLKVRLVKGAYRGDTEDFFEIQERFLTCFDILMKSGKNFDVGTHDPKLVAHILEQLKGPSQKKVCFGFLKGLADETKLDLVKKGFKVAEYVPFGQNSRAYVMRRKAYLRNLARVELEPAR